MESVNSDKMTSTFNYVTIPPCATLLHTRTHRTSSPQLRKQSNSRGKSSPIIRTSLPRSISEDDTDSPNSAGSMGSPILKGFVTSSTFNLIPQVLLSSAGVPTSPQGTSPAAGTSGNSGSNPGGKRTKRYFNQREPVVLLSNRDPLSIPIMSVNFKQFVERVGPVFWLQDRIEEIVFWRRGWRMTCTWLAIYAFICYFPKLVLLLPHLGLIGIMLSTCRYPKPKPPPVPTLFSAAGPPPPETNANTSTPPLPPPVAQDNIDWQANVQAIQNLMGFYATTHAMVTPHLSHLSLAPGSETAKPKSPYALPLLTFLVLTLLPTLFLVTSPYFPFRLVALVAGAGPVILLHPYIYSLITTYIAQRRVTTWVFTLRLPPTIRHLLPLKWKTRIPEFIQLNQTSLRKKFRWTVQRLIDDNNLTDECWNSEIREVELWENERLDRIQALARARSLSTSSSSSGSGTVTEDDETSGPQPTVRLSRIVTNVSPVTGWSKSNLRSGERASWTRGRDGWSGVGSDGSVSNLTFALSPGWNFVSTEDWRADLEASWAGSGDEDGWVYTNDSWVEPQPFPYQGAVTRRRRWVRRIWYDVKSSEKEKENSVGS
ncbi:hypothetical protein E1B28_002760 [Marasmius oreades]|uniref:TECPR1-like DysF domain-containing protein n=1 Tax=Marasmius oreades TaxID=181124 RepID=A0A9P7ULW5_9AGAR|nr:uncharacterized protein E1B28_002760 [Marasmius oreades]KAG7086838.1 hypothetical protein E1B28_002760 [Marasmius oreades]